MPSRVSYEAVFAPQFVEDLRSWIEIDRRAALRILELAQAILRDPFVGLGKPESLKYVFSGCWSRRITQEHRLVYRVSTGRIEFYQATYHY